MLPLGPAADCRRRKRAPILHVALAVGALACGGDPPPEREWTPADHVQPRAPDPTRTPDDSARAQPAQVDPAQAEARAAKALWNVSCASCHGRDGRGQGSGLPPGANAPDFTTAAWQAERDDQALATVITEGRGLMPAFGEQINPQGVSALIKHIRSLGPQGANDE